MNKVVDPMDVLHLFIHRVDLVFTYINMKTLN